MKAYLSPGTLHIYLNNQNSEHILFGKRLPRIESQLQDLQSGDDLGKKVILEYDELQGQRTVVSWKPEDASLDDVQELHVKLSASTQIDLFIKEKIKEQYSLGTIFFNTTNTSELK